MQCSSLWDKTRQRPRRLYFCTDRMCCCFAMRMQPSTAVGACLCTPALPLLRDTLYRSEEHRHMNSLIVHESTRPKSPILFSQPYGVCPTQTPPAPLTTPTAPLAP